MLELTEKEWGCFNEYLKDLLNVLSEEEAMSICDSKYIYTKEELIKLQNKVSNKIRRCS